MKVLSHVLLITIVAILMLLVDYCTSGKLYVEDMTFGFAYWLGLLVGSFVLPFPYKAP